MSTLVSSPGLLTPRNNKIKILFLSLLCVRGLRNEETFEALQFRQTQCGFRSNWASITLLPFNPQNGPFSPYHSTHKQK